MGMRAFTGALCFGCAALFGSSTWAATIEPVQGGLWINQGQGFQPINRRVQANVGDSVMVGPGGTATVAYDDGCMVTVQSGAVATIAPISPCASGSSAAEPRNDYLIWGAVGLGAAGVTIGAIALFERTATTTTTTTTYNSATLGCGISTPCLIQPVSP
jgi:hypothetical protein